VTADLTMGAFLASHGDHGDRGPALCELDGHAPDDSNRYWHCTEPGAVDVEGVLMCLRHAGRLGYGPEQAEYGFDPHDGLNPTPEIRTEEAGQ
jgi:hypothetical protein